MTEKHMILKSLTKVKEELEKMINEQLDVDTLYTESDAEWVVLARKKLNMSQATLSKKIGISKAYLSQIENNKAALSPYHRNQIYELLKCKLG